MSRTGRLPILDGFETEVWGYNGVVPGPTIVSERGRRAIVDRDEPDSGPIPDRLSGLD